MSTRYLFIGSSAASIGAVQKLLMLIPDADIIIITQEQERPYNKCLLADYLAGTKSEQEIRIFERFTAVTIIYATTITAIDRQAKTVTSSAGALFTYDYLFLGIGSSVCLPPIAGVDLPGVFQFHTLADALQIQSYCLLQGVRTVAIIGAGLSGLECADALHAVGLSVTVFERQTQVLAQIITTAGAAFIEQAMANCSISFVPKVTITTIKQGPTLEIFTKEGRIGSADVIVIATGSKANTELARKANLAVSSFGIVVNSQMQTSDPFIFAGGDCVEVTDTITGKKAQSCLWPDAMLQGMTAACALAGRPRPYSGAHLIISSSFFGLKFARAGILDEHCFIKKDQHNHQTYSIEGRILKGFQMIGTDHDFSGLRKAILTKAPFCVAEE